MSKINPLVLPLGVKIFLLSKKRTSRAVMCHASYVTFLNTLPFKSDKELLP